MRFRFNPFYTIFLHRDIHISDVFASLFSGAIGFILKWSLILFFLTFLFLTRTGIILMTLFFLSLVIFSD